MSLRNPGTEFMAANPGTSRESAIDLKSRTAAVLSPVSQKLALPSLSHAGAGVAYGESRARPKIRWVSSWVKVEAEGDAMIVRLYSSYA